MQTSRIVTPLLRPSESTTSTRLRKHVPRVTNRGLHLLENANPSRSSTRSLEPTTSPTKQRGRGQTLSQSFSSRVGTLRTGMPQQGWTNWGSLASVKKEEMDPALMMWWKRTIRIAMETWVRTMSTTVRRRKIWAAVSLRMTRNTGRRNRKRVEPTKCWKAMKSYWTMLNSLKIIEGWQDGSWEIVSLLLKISLCWKGSLLIWMQTRTSK